MTEVQVVNPRPSAATATQPSHREENSDAFQRPERLHDWCSGLDLAAHRSDWQLRGHVDLLTGEADLLRWKGKAEVSAGRCQAWRGGGCGQRGVFWTGSYPQRSQSTITSFFDGVSGNEPKGRHNNLLSEGLSWMHLLELPRKQPIWKYCVDG